MSRRKHRNSDLIYGGVLLRFENTCRVDNANFISPTMSYLYIMGSTERGREVIISAPVWSRHIGQTPTPTFMLSIGLYPRQVRLLKDKIDKAVLAVHEGKCYRDSPVHAIAKSIPFKEGVYVFPNIPFYRTLVAKLVIKFGLYPVPRVIYEQLHEPILRYLVDDHQCKQELRTYSRSHTLTVMLSLCSTLEGIPRELLREIMYYVHLLFKQTIPVEYRCTLPNLHHRK